MYLNVIGGEARSVSIQSTCFVRESAMDNEIDRPESRVGGTGDR